MTKAAFCGAPAHRSKRRMTKTYNTGKILPYLLLAVCLQISVAASAQQITLQVKLAELPAVFASIEKQTGFIFMYTDELLKGAKPVTIDVKNISLNSLLQLVFQDQPIRYKVTRKTIFLSRKEEPKEKHAEEFANGSSLLSPIDVNGRVVNEKGELLDGVTVKLKGTERTTLTGGSGGFAFTAIGQNATLVFSHISMETYEMRVNGKTEMLVRLTTKVSDLGDVTVTVNTGYQQLSRERFVGSASSLDSAAYHRRAGMNIIDRLDGTVPGVQFSKKGGGGVPIMIRGVSTLGVRSGGSQPAFDPLIIVDDFPFTGELSNLNPNDVESITVLKDAVAASIWGTRAGNGVIVVTTKKGKYNQSLRVNAGSNVTVQSKPDLYYFPQMNSSDFIDVEQFLYDKNFYTNAIANPKFNVLSPVVEILERKRKGEITADQANAQIDLLRGIDVRDDYSKYIFRNAVSQQHFINLSGGSNSFNYNFSAGYNASQPEIKGAKPSQQYTISSGNLYRPHKNLELQLGINLSRNVTYQTTVGYPIYTGGGRNALYPYARLADANGAAIPTLREYSRAYADTAGGGKLRDWHYRPLDEIRLANDQTTTQFVRVNVGASYKITEWLKADVQYQYINESSLNRNLQALETYFVSNLINLYTNLAQTTPNLRNPIPVGAILDVNNRTINNQNVRARLGFSKTLSGIHDLTAFIAGDIFENKGQSNGNRFYGYNDKTLAYATGLDYNTRFTFYDGIGSGKIPQLNSLTEAAMNRYVSVTANASYTYDGRYTLYVSARRDGANIFGVNTNNRWKPLWSAGGSWEISKENFFRLNWMPYARLRAAYGYMGNVDNTRSGLPTIMHNSTNLPYTTYPTASLGSAPNPNLKWEEVRTINLGFDFGLLHNRLTGGIEWYQKRSTDLISNIPFDATTGVPAFVVNAANLKGQGVEIKLNTKNIMRKDFVWETGLALAYNKTIVTRYYNGGFKASQFILYGINPTEGQIAWGLSSYRWAGLDPANGDPRGYLNGQISNNYQAIMNDSLKNQVFHGSSMPLYTGFIYNSITWKGITLSVNIKYSLDYYFRKPAIHYTNLFNTWSGHADYAGRWQKAGDETHTDIPSMTYPANNRRDEFYQNAEVNVLRGDHVRLQDLRLSYSWSNKRFKAIPVKSVQLLAYVNNLNIMLWRANKQELDPEFTGGSSGIMLPSNRTWTMGLNIGL